MKKLLSAAILTLASLSAVADRQADIAIAGALIGAAIDSEDRVRGAVIGGALGAVSQSERRDDNRRPDPYYNPRPQVNNYYGPQYYPRPGADYYEPHRYQHQQRVEADRFYHDRAREMARIEHQRRMREYRY